VADRPGDELADLPQSAPADDEPAEVLAQPAHPRPGVDRAAQRRVGLLQGGQGPPVLVEEPGVAQRRRRVRRQAGEQLHVVVAEAPRSPVGGQQHAEGVVADLQRHAEDARELLAARGGVDGGHVAEPGVVEVGLAPQRPAGAQDLPAQALPLAQHDAPQRRAHRAVDDLDAQVPAVPGAQHDVGQVHPQKQPGLRGDLVQQVRGVVQRGQSPGQVVEHLELARVPALLGQPLVQEDGEGGIAVDGVPPVRGQLLHERRAVPVELAAAGGLDQQPQPGRLARVPLVHPAIVGHRTERCMEGRSARSAALWAPPPWERLGPAASLGV